MTPYHGNLQYTNPNLFIKNSKKKFSVSKLIAMYAIKHLVQETIQLFSVSQRTSHVVTTITHPVSLAILVV